MFRLIWLCFCVPLTAAHATRLALPPPSAPEPTCPLLVQSAARAESRATSVLTNIPPELREDFRKVADLMLPVENGGTPWVEPLIAIDLYRGLGVPEADVREMGRARLRQFLDKGRARGVTIPPGVVEAIRDLRLTVPPTALGRIDFAVKYDLAYYRRLLTKLSPVNPETKFKDTGVHVLRYYRDALVQAIELADKIHDHEQKLEAIIHILRLNYYGREPGHLHPSTYELCEAAEGLGDDRTLETLGMLHMVRVVDLLEAPGENIHWELALEEALDAFKRLSEGSLARKNQILEDLADFFISQPTLIKIAEKLVHASGRYRPTELAVRQATATAVHYALEALRYSGVPRKMSRYPNIVKLETEITEPRVVRKIQRLVDWAFAQRALRADNIFAALTAIHDHKRLIQWGERYFAERGTRTRYEERVPYTDAARFFAATGSIALVRRVLDAYESEQAHIDRVDGEDGGWVLYSHYFIPTLAMVKDTERLTELRARIAETLEDYSILGKWADYALDLVDQALAGKPMGYPSNTSPFEPFAPPPPPPTYHTGEYLALEARLRAEMRDGLSVDAAKAASLKTEAERELANDRSKYGYGAQEAIWRFIKIHDRDGLLRAARALIEKNFFLQDALRALVAAAVLTPSSSGESATARPSLP